MKQANFDWKVVEESPDDAFFQLAQEQNLSPLIAKLLWQRGYQTQESIQGFLHPSAEQFHDPYLMHDMEKGVKRIQQAVINGERILIYGDYDADGITSTTVMKETLELLGAEVETFLPNRFEHGYGPNPAVYQEKINEGIQLILTVDNGVSGHEAVTLAQTSGVDVIITDHHELPAELPNAYAVIHPRHPEGNYPFGDLAGVGVAFKVATALLEEPPAEFLDLAAIGTIADLVSLTGENRALVSLGLKAIQQSERLGLQMLFEASGSKMKDADETMIGFSIAPRLNAIGRMGDPNPAVDLLATFDEEEASSLAEKLNTINEQRKGIVESITNEALQMIDPENEIHLLANEDWHEGVLGIVAGKILQETGKPAIVLSKKPDGSAKGSGRSVEALNIYEMLDGMRDLFTHFGGHHAAVGLTMPQENLSVLQEQMNSYVLSQQIDLSKGPQITIDEKLKPKDVSVPFIEELRVMAPFGTDNPLPNFLFEDVGTSNVKQIGANQKHLKLSLTDGEDQLDAVAFGFGNQLSELSSDTVSVVGQLSINEWNGRKKPQLMVTDYAVAGIQLFDWRPKRFWKQKKLAETALYLVFDSRSKKQLDETVQQQSILFENLEQIKQQIDEQQPESLVVADCPADLADLKEVADYGDFSRIYFLGITEDEAYLNGVGSREQYARLFKFIQAQDKVDVRHKTGAVAQYLKIPQKLLVFMIQVFAELGFVTIQDGIMQKVADPVNHPLTDSENYQQRLKKIKIEEFLLLSDVPAIKEWLTK
ncbi:MULTISPECIES: single-stranded-DNA-specific exonuclease RecJ [unclassified Enterococcus]|uniref:single-stranded-DNA-specific exonuclease RecJ n=1 Tax=unclassified Enterococcus TaxID=2608891 RepID=UPI003D283424